MENSSLPEWLSHLEPAEREILMLHFAEDLGYREIALALGIPLGTVKWKAFNAKAKEEGPAERIRAHLAACAECRDLYECMLEATATLRAAGAAYRQTTTLTAAAAAHGRQQVWSRIRTAEDGGSIEDLAGPVLTIGRLRRLQALVAPVCGSRTTFYLILAAVAKMSPAADPAGGDDWRRFVQKLKDLISAFCGTSTARLVWALGQSLEAE